MKLETNCCDMHCHPILNYTESFKTLAHWEAGLKLIAKFVPKKRQKYELVKTINKKI